MTNLVKVLIGVGVAVTGVVVAKKVMKKKYVKVKKNRTSDKTSVETSEDPNAVTEKEDESVGQKIKKYVVKKILAAAIWCSDHKKEIEGITLMVSFSAALLELAGGFRKLTKTPKADKASGPSTWEEMVKRDGPFPSNLEDAANFDERQWTCVDQIDVDQGIIRFYEPRGAEV